jgi:hypothetical protein
VGRRPAEGAVGEGPEDVVDPLLAFELGVLDDLSTRTGDVESTSPMLSNP